MALTELDYIGSGGESYSTFEHLKYWSSSGGTNTYTNSSLPSGLLLVSCDLQYNAGGHIYIDINGTRVVSQVDGTKQVYSYVVPCNANDSISVSISSNSWATIAYLS